MKAFIIHLPDRAHSVAHSTVMLDYLTSIGFDANLFVGTNGNVAQERAAKDQREPYPYSIKHEPVSDDEVESFIRPDMLDLFREQYAYSARKKQLNTNIGKISAPGVIGCFYSHYDLWRLCAELNEPIAIFEDDVKFFQPYYPVDWEDVLILALGKTSFLNEPFKSYMENPPANPQPMTWRNTSMPGTCGYAIKPTAARKLLKFYRKYYAPSDNAINQSICTIQIHNHVMGRTTLPEEGNVSLTRTTEWS